MISKNDLPVREGDKIEIDGADGVFVVDTIVVSVQVTPAGGDKFDRVRYSKDEIVEMHDSGALRVLNEDVSTHPAAQQVAEQIDLDELEAALQGRGGLRVSKPDADGLTQFVWRMVRFHSGADASMPVVAHWWLQEWLDENEIDASVSGVKDGAGKAVLAEIETAVDALIARYGYNPVGGAQAWKRAGVLR